ncbi:MAG: nucleotidyltransferase family protein [Acidobacteria bacterium]|jgi:molybdenum cofactor cytidylyltransferase|nr:nucleotidyltransferase family protein [Acidobacteriota bacterium]
MSRAQGPDSDPEPVAVAVLAAGGSSRLGRAKQLIEWRGDTLLRWAAKTASSAACGPAVVVLGARALRLRRELADLPVKIVINDYWQDGLAGSIRTALAAARSLAPESSGILLTLTDQPLVSVELLRELVDLHRRHPGCPIACAYAGTVGAPALIPRELFAELDELEGDSGARAVLRRHRREVIELPFPAGAHDVDTESDLDDLINHRDP